MQKSGQDKAEAPVRASWRLPGKGLSLLFIAIVKIYQMCLAPILRFFNGGRGHCRHDPSCSNYAILALRRHGPFVGAWLAARRICRCHPWGTFGYDPVPPKQRKDRP